MQQTSIGTCYFKHNILLQYLSSVLQLETFKSLNVPYVTLSNSLELPFNSVHLGLHVWWSQIWLQVTRSLEYLLRFTGHGAINETRPCLLITHIYRLHCL